jgi:3D (Asp-Asp-Asp) domain-containing protein
MKLSSLKIYLAKIAFSKKGVYILIIAIFIAIFCLPIISSLANYQPEDNYYQKLQHLVRLKFKPQAKIMNIHVTAYSSTPEQTDETPCIAASGYDLCKYNKENVVACNFLPFGTKVKFPELDPNKTYTVVDRMHERFNSRMDIWITDKNKARQFGVKYLKVEIYQ